MNGYKNVPASSQMVILDDRSLSESHSIDSKSNGESCVPRDTKPVGNNSFSVGNMFRVLGAFLGRILAYSKTDQDADAGANVRHDAQTSLKRVLEFDTVVSQGKATNQDTVTRPSHHIDGLDNKRDDLALRMYKHSKTICYKAFYVIGMWFGHGAILRH